MFQLCLSASITTTESSNVACSNSSATFFAELCGISEKLSAFHGANLQWADQYISVLNSHDSHVPFSTAMESMVCTQSKEIKNKSHLFDRFLFVQARFYSMTFDLDFAKINQTIYDEVRDIYGFGVDIPTANRTIEECFNDYFRGKSWKEIMSAQEESTKKFNSAITKGVEASKARKIVHYEQKKDLFMRSGSIKEDAVLVSIDFSLPFKMVPFFKHKNNFK